jgi:hypothetical protein
MNTKVLRFVIDPGFDLTLAQTCDNYLAVGYRLVALVVLGTEMLAVFQKL